MTDTTKLRAGHGLRLPTTDTRGASARRDYDEAIAPMRQAADELEALRRENIELREQLNNSKREWEMP